MAAPLRFRSNLPIFTRYLQAFPLPFHGNRINHPTIAHLHARPMTQNAFREVLVSPETLLEALERKGESSPNVIVLDATLPNPMAENDAIPPKDGFIQDRIPGAQFLDLDAISDASFAPGVGHNLPTNETFNATMQALGITDAHAPIVTYDQSGLFSSPRAWFTLRAFGLRNVRILSGGLPAWKRLAYPTESGPIPAENVEHDDEKDQNLQTGRAAFEKVTSLQWGLEDMKANVGKGEAGVQVVDARSLGRFKGEEAEPREGARGGHIPGSLSLPFGSLLEAHESGSGVTQVGKDRLAAAVAASKVDLGKPVVASCGSGLTAAHLALALYRLGVDDVAIYDGR